MGDRWLDEVRADADTYTPVQLVQALAVVEDHIILLDYPGARDDDAALRAEYEQGRAELAMKLVLKCVPTFWIKVPPQFGPDATIADGLAAVGLPATAGLADLIEHHRANAALAAVFRMMSGRSDADRPGG